MNAQPKPTDYTCRSCGAAVLQEEYSKVVPDQEGNPDEQTSLGYFCSNELCPSHLIALEPEEMMTEEESTTTHELE